MRGPPRKLLRSAALVADNHGPLLASLASAVIGGALVALLISRPGARIEDVLFPALVFGGCALTMAPRRPWSLVLRNFSSVAMAGAGSALGALLLTVGAVLGLWPAIGVLGLLSLWAGSTLAAAATIALARWARGHCQPVRLAVVGSAGLAEDLGTEIARGLRSRWEVVGYVADGAATTQDPGSQPLGSVSELPSIIVAWRLELLVLAPGASRQQFYDQLASNCLASGIRIAEFDDFCERMFGHVPVGAINSRWFQHLVAIGRPPDRRLLKRLADLVMAVVLGVLVAPLLALLAAIIRRDGAPALYRQPRIGEGGRPFTILKLRTMRVNHEVTARWTAEDDPRVTKIGRLLRATHVDELPQLINVLRGEMSIVGPRPEQPAIVDRLAAMIPYYGPRHLAKPGIAGWAQARCGYGGSNDGSMWKVCHDLYYLRHRSLRFDIAILAETMHAMLFNDALDRHIAWRLNRLRDANPSGAPHDQEIFVEALQPADESL